MNMKIWKRNAIIAVVMVLICGGIYLNWLYEKDSVDLTNVLDADKIMGESTLVINDETNLAVEAANTVATEQESYFAQMRLSRQNARDEAVSLLQETMAYAEGEDVNHSSEKLEAIISEALAESQIESLVIAKGYTDCVAYINEEGISVAVAMPEEGLEQGDVSLLADIVMAQTDYALSDIRIFGVE